jgi:WD40 repeat protein
LTTLRGSEAAVTVVALSPCGEFAVTGHRSGEVLVYEIARRTFVVLRGHDALVANAYCLPCADSVLTASNDGTARVWSMAARDLVATLANQDEYARILAIDRCSRRFVVTGDAAFASIHAIPEGDRTQSIRGVSSSIWSAAFCTASGALIIGDLTGKITHCAAHAEGGPTWERRCGHTLITSVDLSPSGRLFLATSGSVGLVIGTTLDGEVLTELGDARDGIYRAFFAGSNSIVTVGYSTIQEWGLLGV